MAVAYMDVALYFCLGEADLVDLDLMEVQIAVAPHLYYRKMADLEESEISQEAAVQVFLDM